MLDELTRSVARADAFEYWTWVGPLLVSVPVALIWGFARLRLSRTIRDLPTSKVRSAHQGYVELEGIGRIVDFDIHSPLSQVKCLWWHYRVEEKDTDSEGKARWRTVEEVSSEEPFWLEDDTGRCMVIPIGAEVVPSQVRTWYGDSREDAAGPQSAAGTGQFRYTERLLWRDAPLYAIGSFCTVSVDPAENRKAATAEKLIAWKQERGAMKLFDVDNDGRVDQREWSAAIRVARRQAERETPLQPDTLHTLAQARDGRHLVLSAKPQARLARNFKAQSRFALGWFIVVGTIVVWLLQARFGR